MATQALPSLNVHIDDLSPLTVACFTCQLDQATGQFSTEIGDGFELVKRWAAQRGDTARQLIIGIPHLQEQRLIAYDCCVQIPDTSIPLPAGWTTQQVDGGRYAVLTLEKDSATIGERIGQFFAQYVPQHHLTIDPHRPSYEVYYARTMDYCVPIA